MGLDPALQEAGWHGEVHGLVLHGFQIHTGEPARENILANARPQTALHASPVILFHVRHRSYFSNSKVMTERTQRPRRVHAKACDDLSRLLSGKASPFGVHAANGSAMLKEAPGEVSAY
jgi:hypothetical protein